MSLSVIQGALELGLIFAIMSLGIFISFRILNIPDLTIDGTFTLGTSVSAILTVNGHPVLGIIFAIAAGGLAGCVTGFLQTKMKVQPILAGILTMTALYSVNLRVMGQKPNLSLFDKESIFSGLTRLIGEQFADLIMIDLHQPNMQPLNNIVKNIVYSGSKQNIKMTMVNGKILYENGEFFIGISAEDVYAKANEIISRMRIKYL